MTECKCKQRCKCQCSCGQGAPYEYDPGTEPAARSVAPTKVRVTVKFLDPKEVELVAEGVLTSYSETRPVDIQNGLVVSSGPHCLSLTVQIKPETQGPLD